MKTRVFSVGSQDLVLKVPKRGQFHAAIHHVTTKRCDSCARGALGKLTVSRADAVSLAKRCGETSHQHLVFGSLLL